MASRFETKTIVIASLALILALALGYGGYRIHHKREVEKAILGLVTDTSTRLRDALAIENAPPTLEPAQFIRKLDEHAGSAERNLELLKRLDGKASLRLADAADDYLLTAREILRKQAESRRHRRLMEESAQALRQHMQGDNRTGAWVQDAVKAKERVNKDYRAYGLAADALDKLLGSFTASQEKIAPFVAPSVLIAEGTVAEARRRAREQARQVASEFGKLQQPGAAR